MPALVLYLPRCLPLPHRAVGDWLAPFLPFALLATEAGDEADQDAMLRLRAGDSLALKNLFDRWKRPLISFLYRSLGSHADAEDLALQTFEKVYRAADRYRPEGRFASWLFAIARNELRHELRRRKRKPLHPIEPEQLEWAASHETIDPARHTRELEEEILQALQTLPERQRSALLLSAADELTASEIAAALGISTNTLYVTLHRARQALRANLATDHENAQPRP